MPRKTLPSPFPCVQSSPGHFLSLQCLVVVFFVVLLLLVVVFCMGLALAFDASFRLLLRWVLGHVWWLARVGASLSLVVFASVCVMSVVMSLS